MVYRNPSAWHNTYAEQIVDLNVKPETIKLWGEKTGENLCEIRLAIDFLDATRKAWSREEKNG